MKLNIGCGKSYFDGYKNIDISKGVKTDECYDINNGIKEKDGSIEEIEAGCVLEQVNDFKFVLNECWRVLQEGGILKGYVPSTDPRVMHLDPEDKMFFQIGTFDYFNKNKQHWENFGKSYGYKGWSETEAEINEGGIIHFKLTK
jgi:predicted SAM-dependent methyltransferase